MNTKCDSPLKHFIIISGGTIINLIVGILTTPIITRLVEPAEYGQLSIFNLYASMAVMLFSLGLDQALVRFYYVEDDIEYRRMIVRKCWIIPVTIASFFGILFWVLYYKDCISFEFELNIVFVLVIYINLQIISRISSLVMRLEYHSKKYSIVNIAHKVIYAILAILLINLMNKNQLLILTLCLAIATFITLILGVMFEKNIWCTAMRSRKYSQPNLGVLIKYGMPFILTNGISTVFQGIDKFSLNYFCSYEEVGVYSSAMSLVNIFGIVQSSFNALWAPMATEHFEKNRDDKTFYQKGNAYITILMFLLGICLIFFKNILVILLGEKYREAASILPCLCFYPIMYTISETTVSGINFANKSYLHILVVLGACIINVIGNLLLVPILGGRGAAIATGASYIVFFVLRTYFANKCFPVNFKLKRFRILVCVTFVYALYNTFSEFNVIEVLMFFIVLFILYVLYRKEIAEGLTIIIKQISIQFKKKVVGGNE